MNGSGWFGSSSMNGSVRLKKGFGEEDGGMIAG